MVNRVVNECLSSGPADPLPAKNGFGGFLLRHLLRESPTRPEMRAAVEESFWLCRVALCFLLRGSGRNVGYVRDGYCGDGPAWSRDFLGSCVRGCALGL